MNIEIDKKSGFCFGVVTAIKKAETELEDNDILLCLGDIEHNNEEVKRLEGLGLRTIDRETFKTTLGKKVLIRAHGEPPETYQIAKDNRITLIDATCPVVLKLQEKVKRAWLEMKSKQGKVVIFGKKGHAEVLGLIGQTEGDAIIVEKPDDLNNLDYSKPITLFSQTTMSPKEYQLLQVKIRQKMESHFKTNEIPLLIYNSTCGQVAIRKKEIEKFAKKHQVVIFVSGVKSSNGKMLFEICKKSNPDSHFISSPVEVLIEWFNGIEDVGICGATSTPVWLMEQVRDKIFSITK